jgi:hypothetical protein
MNRVWLKHDSQDRILEAKVVSNITKTRLLRPCFVADKNQHFIESKSFISKNGPVSLEMRVLK